MTEQIHIRCSKQEKSRLQWLADTYSSGNLSAWLIYCGLKMPRETIVVEKFRESDRRIKMPEDDASGIKY